MDVSYKPNYRVAGQMFGRNIREFADYLANISASDIEKFNNGCLQIKIGDVDYDINSSIVSVKISSKEGYDVVVNDNKVLVLNTNLTPELINEGIARETISKIQQLRKSNDYDIADRINVYYSANDDYAKAISDFIDFIKKETLATSIVRVDDIDDVISINGYDVGIRLEVVK